MAIPIGAISKGGATAGLGLFGILWKYKYWFVLAIVLIPLIIGSVNEAIETNNPSLPFFQLATSIFVADSVLGELVDDLEENPDNVVRMKKPTSGIWSKTKYFFLSLSRIWWKIFTLVYLIFLPLVLIYKTIRFRNTSEPSKNIMYASLLFILYLFVANTIVVIYDMSIGTELIDIPKDVERFEGYYLTLLNVLPLHGLYSLVIYLGSLAQT
tara:strand:- start:7361 stop:7996 length:636 start_codon:yes stop_codon:yes gene_type:complete